MKRKIALVLAFVLLLTQPVSSMAQNITDSSSVKVKENLQYAFTYTEYTDDDHSIVRTYRKTDDGEFGVASSDARREKTKSVLTSLGMSSTFVNELSLNDLEEYADSLQIVSVTSYTKTDAEGKIVNVPEEEAMTRALDPLRPPNIWDGDGGGESEPTYSGEMTDTYMKLTLIVSYKGDGLYKFSVDAEWLTMPVFRSYDSLGICAYDVTVENETRSGWIKYTEKVLYTANGSYTETNYKHDFVIGNYGGAFHTVRNNSWMGAAVVFMLPMNSALPSVVTSYTGLAAHFEYKGYVHDLDANQRFNVVGSYDHVTYMLTYEPSVTIDLNADPFGVSLSFSLPAYPDISEVKETRVVELPTSIDYIPE